MEQKIEKELIKRNICIDTVEVVKDWNGEFYFYSKYLKGFIATNLEDSFYDDKIVLFVSKEIIDSFI